ncbi:MAG: hypothetical protein OXM01_07265 [Gemmatimonadota bacterium]|nr:hypothetical protein [Gemmatimonadota bacterium]
MFKLTLLALISNGPASMRGLRWFLLLAFGVLSCSREPPVASAPMQGNAALKALALPTASIQPSPSLYRFTVAPNEWIPFTVYTDADSVRVIVNPTGSDAVLEAASGNRPPPTSYCPAEPNETPAAFKNGATLYLQACGVGRTAIRIEEFYYDHPIQHYRAIRVEQADLVGDYRATAVLLPAANEYDSPQYTLTTTDVDYFRFDLDRTALVEVFSSGSTDTHGTLEDAWGNWINADDDGGTGQNFKLSKGLMPGTYYVRVRGYFTYRSDAYRLHLRVRGESTPPASDVSGFNIEVVHLSQALLSREHKAACQRAADRWEEVITGDLHDVDFSLVPYNQWNETVNARITVEDTVDDLRIFVRIKKLEEDVAGIGGPFWVRLGNKLPILAIIAIDQDELNSDLDSFYSLVLHEMGHCLGFGTIWDGLGLLNDPSTDNPLADPHFSGFMARVWFNALGGATYRGAKVPVEQGNDGHWRTRVFGDELMIHGWVSPYQAPLSDITLASMSDLGYQVNWNAADRYRIPRSVAKPTAAEAPPQCRVIRQPIHVVAEDGRVVDVLGP